MNILANTKAAADRRAELDAMTVDQIWQVANSGRLSREEFAYWVEEREGKAWSEGNDSGFQAGYDTGTDAY